MEAGKVVGRGLEARGWRLGAGGWGLQAASGWRRRVVGWRLGAGGSMEVGARRLEVKYGENSVATPWKVSAYFQAPNFNQKVCVSKCEKIGEK